jgi:hypothetical protein
MEVPMRKHRVAILIGLLIVLLIALAAGLLLAHPAAFTAPGVSARMPQKYLAATPQNLEALGLSFIQVNGSDNQAQGAIGKDQAITAALHGEPDLKAATSVSAMLGLLTDPDLQQAVNQGVAIDPHLADMGLVWLLTFNGIETSSSGPAGAPHATSNQLNVVIDAKTGNFVEAFPLFDVTPSAPSINISGSGGPPTVAAPLPPAYAIPTLAPTFAP